MTLEPLDRGPIIDGPDANETPNPLAVHETLVEGASALTPHVLEKIGDGIETPQDPEELSAEQKAEAAKVEKEHQAIRESAQQWRDRLLKTTGKTGVATGSHEESFSSFFR